MATEFAVLYIVWVLHLRMDYSTENLTIQKLSDYNILAHTFIGSSNYNFQLSVP